MHENEADQALRRSARSEAGFVDMTLANPANAKILARLHELDASDVWLVAGCLCQTVWNVLSGRPPEEAIKDYDIFYFDGEDLSWEAEDRVIRKADALFAGLDVAIEVRNQARVHLWYEAHFGTDYPRLSSSADGIARFPVRGTCVGLRMRGGRPNLCAPYGLEDLVNGILRPNELLGRPELFTAKAESYRERWPWLRIAA